MDIFQKIAESKSNNEAFWIVTVLGVAGSTPARPGMKMLVYEDGSIFGTVGGGDIEKHIIDKIVSVKPDEIAVWSYNLGTSNKTSEQTNMECGGIQDVIVEPVTGRNNLYIIGGGHCGMALSSLASKADFAVTVIDNRSEWANKDKHPDAIKCICADYNKVNEFIRFSEDSTYIVIMTHAHENDEFVLKKIINEKYKYLGMIGSERKVNIVKQRMLNEGFSREKIDKLFSPIGLEIGSHTPVEIAISIMAQIISIRYGKFNK
jgi:xanthine dehydrogenase accessory factor